MFFLKENSENVDKYGNVTWKYNSVRSQSNDASESWQPIVDQIIFLRYLKSTLYVESTQYLLSARRNYRH